MYQNHCPFPWHNFCAASIFLAAKRLRLNEIASFIDVSKQILKPNSTLMPLMMMLLTRPGACLISALDARGPRCLAASTATHYQFSNDILKTGSRHRALGVDLSLKILYKRESEGIHIGIVMG